MPSLHLDPLTLAEILEAESAANRVKRGPRKRPEQRLQIQIAEWLDWVVAPPAWWSHFPAGGGGFSRGRSLKAMGLKPGLPDLIFWHDQRTYGIELKTTAGVLSPAQRYAHAKLLNAGVPVVTCRTLDDVEVTLKTWGIPMRESKPFGR